MRGVQLGQLRINLDHLVWYSPSATIQGDESGEQQAEISLKTTDTAQAISIRYRTTEKRDQDVFRLDEIFAVAGAAHDSSSDESERRAHHDE